MSSIFLPIFYNLIPYSISAATLDIRFQRNIDFKVGLSPSKKIVFIYFNESPLKMMKNVFYFVLKALFIPKMFKFLF